MCLKRTGFDEYILQVLPGAEEKLKKARFRRGIFPYYKVPQRNPGQVPAILWRAMLYRHVGRIHSN